MRVVRLASRILAVGKRTLMKMKGIAMMQAIKLTGLAVVSLLFVSPAFAGDANTTTGGWIEAFQANSGSGTQTNAETWHAIENALAGSGTQATAIEVDANTGSGSQDNSVTTQDEWEFIDHANSGTGGQVIDSLNSNSGDRISSDIVMVLGDVPVVANAALEGSISGNSVSVSGAGGSAGTGLAMTNGSGFRNLAGISAIALSSGHNSSQNVSVNVTAAVSAEQVVSAPAGESAAP